MTVDMLAAAFIWPEEVLAGRPDFATDPHPMAAEVDPAPLGTADLDATPFWAALIRRFRAAPTSTGADLH